MKGNCLLVLLPSSLLLLYFDYPYLDPHMEWSDLFVEREVTFFFSKEFILLELQLSYSILPYKLLGSIIKLVGFSTLWNANIDSRMKKYTIGNIYKHG